MKIQLVVVNAFEPGDRVITPDGYGTVISDNISSFKTGQIYNKDFFHEVIVQHDEDTSDNPSNQPKKMDASLPSLLEYGEEGYNPKKGCINDTSK